MSDPNSDLARRVEVHLELHFGGPSSLAGQALVRDLWDALQQTQRSADAWRDDAHRYAQNTASWQAKAEAAEKRAEDTYNDGVRRELAALKERDIALKRVAELEANTPYWHNHHVALIATVERLEAALQDLYDVQNGSPLPSYEKAWNAAMQAASEALARAASPQETKL